MLVIFSADDMCLQLQHHILATLQCHMITTDALLHNTLQHHNYACNRCNSHVLGIVFEHTQLFSHNWCHCRLATDVTLCLQQLCLQLTHLCFATDATSYACNWCNSMCFATVVTPQACNYILLYNLPLQLHIQHIFKELFLHIEDLSCISWGVNTWKSQKYKGPGTLY